MANNGVKQRLEAVLEQVKNLCSIVENHKIEINKIKKEKEACEALINTLNAEKEELTNQLAKAEENNNATLAELESIITEIEEALQEEFI